jgi:hypothetical protein
MSYPVPANEAERLRTLRSYKILDTKPEERFDELTRLAASGESAGSLDEIISRLQGVASDLQAVREGRTSTG